MKKNVIFAVSLLFLITSTAFAQATSEAKHALLIANSNYKNFGSLATPVKEAEELKVTLEKLNFAVTIVEDASKEKIIDALYDFQQKISKAGGIAFFHYGGHAVQVSGKNYIIPVDADIPDERRVSTRAVDLDEIMSSMQGDTNIVILDACRNNPLPASSGRSATRGLVLSEFKPKNSIIVYSAQPGKVAQDGVFTPILTRNLLEEKSFTDVLMDTRREVRKRTNNEQSPGEYNELETPIYLAGYTPTTTTGQTVTENSINNNPTNTTSTNTTSSNVSYTDNTFTNNTPVNQNVVEEQNYATTFDEYMAYAKNNDPEAQYNLGYMYETGDGVGQDLMQAKKWYEKAAKQNHPDAQYALAALYYYDNGVIKQDYKEAKKWFEKAAYNNDDYAMNLLGVIYELGRGTAQDYDEALRWYLKAAEKNNVYAQKNLGLLYLNGNGVRQNYKEAKKWLEKSAEQNNSYAKACLGYLYTYGYGVSQNYTEAKKWFDAAASQEESLAQYYLGYLYENGYGVKQNINEAKKWYKLAAEQGDEDAEARLKALSDSNINQNDYDDYDYYGSYDNYDNNDDDDDDYDFFDFFY